MSEFVSVVFCRNCGSRFVEISEWSENNNPIFHCRSCNAKEELKGFTLSRCSVKKSELQKAKDDLPKKKEFER